MDKLSSVKRKGKERKGKALGFKDTEVGGLGRQSISVCGYMSGREVPLSLSGWLDLSNNSLQLSRWIANATSPENVYYQSDVESWLLRKK